MKTTLACAALSALAVAVPAAAQTFPNKPIRLVVPFAAGGPGDFVARLIAPKMTETLGQTVVVDNRGGANGIIATETIAKAAPDGYSLLIISAGFTVNATLYTKLPYDPLKDFAPISLANSGPAIVVVNPNVPVKSIKDLIAYAKTQQGKINYASSGIGAPSHLAVELFKTMTGTEMAHIAYKGMAPGMVDLIAGQVQVAFPTISAALSHVRTGRLRGLAVTSSQRSPAATELPTISEAGVPGYEASNWYGVAAPAGTPRAIIMRLHNDMAKAIATTDVKEKMLAQGMDAVSRTPDEFSAYIKSEIGKWAKVIKAAGVKQE
jgi:tripartite-type tricarboxylate transporter receptor subunit TctC